MRRREFWIPRAAHVADVSLVFAIQQLRFRMLHFHNIRASAGRLLFQQLRVCFVCTDLGALTYTVRYRRLS
jgi:hypothetical protein